MEERNEELEFYRAENQRLTRLIAGTLNGKVVQSDNAVELKKQIVELTDTLAAARLDLERTSQECEEVKAALTSAKEQWETERYEAKRALENESCSTNHLAVRVVELEKALEVQTKEHEFWKATAEAELVVSKEFQAKYEAKVKEQTPPPTPAPVLEQATNRELQNKLRSAQEEIVVLRGSNVSQGEGYAKLWQERDEARKLLAEAQVLIRSLQAAQVSHESHKNGSNSPENPKSEAVVVPFVKPGDKVVRTKGKKKEELLIERIDGKQILCSIIGKPNSSHWLHQDVVSALLPK